MTRRLVIPGVALLTEALACAPARAHDGLADTGVFRPWLAAGLAAMLLLHLCGTARLVPRASRGHGHVKASAAAFSLGMALVAAATLGPLHALGTRLFTAHMIEHEILVLVAAPILVWARPGAGLSWGCPRAVRRALAAVRSRAPVRAMRTTLGGPVAATTLHAVAIWMWHLPVAYEAALRHESVHVLQHACLLGTAILFWRALLRGPKGAQGHGAAVLCLLVTTLHTGFLGILLTLAPRPLYPSQSSAGDWGLTALADQQIAGLVMWVPGGMIYTSFALALAGLWVAGTSVAPRH